MTIKFAYDLDGVLFDFEKAFCGRFGTKNRHMFDSVERFKGLGFDEDIVQFVKNPDTYFDLSPIFGGITFLHEAHDHNFEIVYITGRDISSKSQTENSLSYYSLPFGELIFSKDKAKVIEEHNRVNSTKIRVLVDDYPKVLKSLPAGVVGLCWAQPWNEGVYPRARYNALDMKVEIKTDIVSEWKGIWETSNGH